MRLASLDLWPDAPALDNTYRPWEGAEPMNCKERFVLGLRHDLGSPRADRGDRAAKCCGPTGSGVDAIRDGLKAHKHETRRHEDTKMHEDGLRF